MKLSWWRKGRKYDRDPKNDFQDGYNAGKRTAAKTLEALSKALEEAQAAIESLLKK